MKCPINDCLTTLEVWENETEKLLGCPNCGRCYIEHGDYLELVEGNYFLKVVDK